MLINSAQKECGNINFTSLISLIPENIVEYYQQGSANRSSVIVTLRQLREQVAEFWLNTPGEQLESSYSSDVGKIHQMLLNSGIKGEPPTDIEQNFVQELVARISRGVDEPKFIQYLLAAMLYRRAYQLPLQYDFAAIPPWFVVDYLKYIIYSPVYFDEIGEIDRYYQHLQKLIDYVHTNIYSHQESGLWRYVASLVSQNLSFTSIQCITTNLREIFIKRAEIIEFVLRLNNYQIDYVFPERGKNQKIRLGILAENYNPQPEAYNTLPIFEYLDRDKFEIILYALKVNGHPLEQYCQSRAHRLVELPQELHAQVQIIRADELDIMLICTAVTDYTSERALLALHRLARIQAAYFAASPVTTGMRNIDYYISDKLLEPEQGAQDHYREKLLMLDGPGCCFNFAVEPEVPTVKPDRRNIGVVSEETVVYISGASPYKIIPELRETWAKILANVPNSVLVLYPSHSDQYLHRKLSVTFEKYGIEKNRLIILKIRGRSNVKECLKLSDVYLNSYPYAGAASIIEALEVGIPTVVMDGNTLRSKTAAALVRDLQIPDLIVESEESYIQLAIALGTNPELRQQKREQIRQKMQSHPRFMDSRAYSAQIGALFQELCQQQLNI